MRILFLSTVFPDRHRPWWGTFNAELCAALARQHDVTVVAPRSLLRGLPPGAALAPAFLGGKARLEISYPRFLHLPGVLRSFLAEQMWQSLRSVLATTVRRARPDVIVSYWLHPDAAVANRLARAVGVPSIAMVGGSDVMVRRRSSRRARAFRHAIGESTAVVAVCETLRRAAIKLAEGKARVYTVNRGVDTQLFSLGSRVAERERLGLALDDPLFVWVGHMVPVKRLDVLLAAWPQVVDVLPAATLAVIGDGADRARAVRMARGQFWERSVRFLGGLLPSLLPAWYRAADATVLSSDSEGLPNVLRESLACGTPFVATDVGGIRDLRIHPPSVLVPSGDPDALARGMIQVLRTHSDGSPSMETRPRTWDDMAAELSELFEQIIDGFSAPAVAVDGNGRSDQVPVGVAELTER